MESRDSAVPEIPGGKTLTVTILADNEKPIPQAKFSYFGEPKPHSAKGHRHYVETDDKGQFTIRFKANTTQKLFELQVDHPGFAPYNAQWENTSIDPVPETFTIKLEKAITGGGTVLDDEDKPLPNADVEFCIHWANRSRTPQICSYRVWVKTDENGKWSFDLLPPGMLNRSVYMHVNCKGFMPFEKEVPLSELIPDTDGALKQSVKMERGNTIKGRVIDETGKPIAGAVVYSNYMETREETDTKTDAHGEFKIDNLPDSNDAYLGVYAPGKMSTIKEMTISKMSPPVEVVMKPQGKPIKIKIIDKEGKPVSGFWIAIERWGKHRLVNDVLFQGKPGERGKTGKDGVWVWAAAPEMEVVFDMFDGIHLDLRNKLVTARDEEYVFTAAPALRVTGKVLDAATNEPVPAFTVYLGIGFEGSKELSWELQANAGKGGFYSIGETYERTKFGIKIEAAGYETATSRDIQNDEGSVTVDFSLKKLSADKLSQTLHGTVLTPDGSPASGATLAAATGKQWHHIENGRMLLGNRPPYVIKTDDSGKFQFAYIDFKAETPQQRQGWFAKKPDDYSLIAFHSAGCKSITQTEWETTYKDKPITLEKYGRIEGAVINANEPVRLRYSVAFPEHIMWECSVTSKADGTFVLENVPASSGTVTIGIRAGNVTAYSGGVKTQVKSGETSTVTMDRSKADTEEQVLNKYNESMNNMKRRTEKIIKTGQKAPDFEIKQILPDGSDAKLKLSDYKGKYVVLDFWATWCVPCIQKLPEHQKFYELMKNNPKFVMMGIALDNTDSADEVAKFVSERKMPWLHGLPGGINATMLKEYGIEAIPALLLIGTDGNVLLSNPTIDELKKTLDGI
jgi:thiol-disulfide isomerase/thioredoxin